jgi:transcriptional regulator with XRE-family HTH domain
VGQPLATLKETRLEQGLRLVDVAKKAGCSISLVSMTESGYRPGEQVRSAMAHAVGASLGSFWHESAQ